MNPFHRLLWISLALPALPLAVNAQGRVRWEGSGGWAQSAEFVRRFDTNALVTIAGTIVRLETFTPGRRMSPGVRAVVESPAGRIPVQLGPQWFVERQDVRLGAADPVVVSGSRVPIGEDFVVVATTVVRGDQTLHLRDEDGTPLWSGGPTRPRTSPPAAGRWTLQLPEGEVSRGKTAFRDLWCHACHVVRGHESEFPAPYAQPPVPVVLGLESRTPGRMDLVNSLINPSHRIEPGFQKELVRTGQFSRMGDYNETMTLQQLSDLVAFLESLPR
ncbi:MAG: c-type cytochrome [Verrucomicrobiae bacterium]|nr:c-type cytochrome [Verrucomicrobiae bacterium]